MIEKSRPSTKSHATCVAVTGSKGGVGKSNLALNLAVLLGRGGRRVLLVDGDLGLANLDVLLGLVPGRTVDELIRGEAHIDELLLDGPQGVRVLPAASGVSQLADLDLAGRTKLLAALAEGAESADDLLIDTGSGVGTTTLSLQLAASRVIVVTTNEPPSLVDAFASMKLLWRADPDKPVDLVVNKAASEEEAQKTYEQLARACSHFLGQAPRWLGPVYSDPLLPGAVRSQRALAELHPSSRATRCYERIALQLCAERELGGESGFWHRLADLAEGVH
ncbi:MAG: MinD/ParA family protein [bacterium]|nr:MinD/ParA family protein [bacterium]